MRPHQGCEQPQLPRTDFDHGVQKLGTRLLVVWFGCVCNALDPDRGSSSTERGELVEASEGLKTPSSAPVASCAVSDWAISA